MSFMPHPFPLPLTVPAARPTLKLALQGEEKDAPFARVHFPGEIGQESLDLLRARALELHQMSSPEQNLEEAKVFLTYRDTENDLCFILSGEDLKAALSSSTAPLRVLARVELPSIPNISASTQTGHNGQSFSETPVHEVVQALIGVMMAASAALQNRVGADSPMGFEAVQEETCGGRSAPADKTGTTAESGVSTEENCPFIHGRHTCDGCLVSPIIGKRFHALNLSNYDLCAMCKDKYEGDEITFEEAENEHDAKMQERWNRRLSKWSKKVDKQQEKWARKQMRRPGTAAEFGTPVIVRGVRERGCGGPRHWNHRRFSGPKPENPESPSEQVDQALKEAIRLSMLEVQANNHKDDKVGMKNGGAEATDKAPSDGNEKPVEEQVEDAMKDAENALKKVGPALKQAIRRSVRNVKLSAKKVEEEVLKEVGPALQEAIRWSMQMRGRKGAEKQPSEGTPKKFPKQKIPAEKTAMEETLVSAAAVLLKEKIAIPPEAPVGAYPAVGEFKMPETNEAMAHGTMEARKSHVGDEKEATSPFIASKGNVEGAKTMNCGTVEANESISDLEELGPCASVLAPVLDGEEETEDDEKNKDIIVIAAEEVEPCDHKYDREKSEDGESNSCDREEESGDDESNSFDREEESGDDGSNNSWGIVDGNGDVLGDDEALAAGVRVIGSALFESGMSSDSGLVRWSKQLSKLHELGFNQDSTNLEIMERLKAANIGSGDYEEISVESIVNELVSEW